MPASRPKTYVQEKLQERQTFLEPALLHDIAQGFDNTPLEECLAQLSARVTLDNICVQGGELLHAHAAEGQLAESPLQHWIGWADKATHELGLQGRELLFVAAYNEYTTDRNQREEGWHHTIIHGELLLTSPSQPERSIVFSASGDTYMDVGSVGQLYNFLHDQVVMYLNGEPFWTDFDLYGDYTREDYSHYPEPQETGLETEEERTARLQDVFAATFPKQTLSVEEAVALLERIKLYFAPQPRPYGHGEF